MSWGREGVNKLIMQPTHPEAGLACLARVVGDKGGLSSSNLGLQGSILLSLSYLRGPHPGYSRAHKRYQEAE